MAQKTKLYTRKQLNRYRSARDADRKAGEKTERMAQKRLGRGSPSVDSALRGCEDR